jgi:L-lactate dehydrogenase complex protein LldE
MDLGVLLVPSATAADGRFVEGARRESRVVYPLLLRGIELVEIDRLDECCGFGGSFCVTDDAVSTRMGYDRFHDFHRQGAEYIVSADKSCLMHRKGLIDRLKLPMKVIHIAQVLNGGPL